MMPGPPPAPDSRCKEERRPDGQVCVTCFDEKGTGHPPGLLVPGGHGHGRRDVRRHARRPGRTTRTAQRAFFSRRRTVVASLAVTSAVAGSKPGAIAVMVWLVPLSRWTRVGRHGPAVQQQPRAPRRDLHRDQHRRPRLHRLPGDRLGRGGALGRRGLDGGGLRWMPGGCPRPPVSAPRPRTAPPRPAPRRRTPRGGSFRSRRAVSCRPRVAGRRRTAAGSPGSPATGAGARRTSRPSASSGSCAPARPGRPRWGERILRVVGHPPHRTPLVTQREGPGC